MSSCDNLRPEDPIVGLDVCGRVYYCHQSTLTQVSPYFCHRFNGNFDAGVAYTDPHGRNVYFVERDPMAFAYIFKYMVPPPPTVVASYRITLAIRD